MAFKVGVVTVVASLTVAAAAFAVSLTSGSLLLGPSSHVSQTAFEGYYD
jgi:hypothetical protein